MTQDIAIDFDPDALRERYRQERDRRLRADGNAQYVAIEGDFAHYLEDPYVEPGFTRAPIVQRMEVLIIGGGFSGLLTAARLRQVGIEDVRLLEKAGDFGGTWYWNRYPGAACDTESYIYMPLLEETGYMPSAKYAKAPELYEHARRIGRHFGLYDRTCFQTVVTDLRWDEAMARWIARTDRNDTFQARYVVLASGLLHRAKLPGIEGLGTFEGHSFHTSRWDYNYTGGDANGGLSKLADKCVGIIGTGATAVQCVPHLGASARELFVFQRTPSSVDVRNNQPTDPQWASSLKPGWQRERAGNFTTVLSGGKFDVDLVNDGWTDIIGEVVLAARRKASAGEHVEDPAKLIQTADFAKMQRVRARVDSIVKNPQTAAALKPWYDQFCKRPCFHDEYLPTFNRPNVQLVDTQGKGVERITPRGVVANGREYRLDCLIFATGFETATSYTHKIGFEIHGRNGITLTEKWDQGAETLHGLFTRGFPNLAVMSATQAALCPNAQQTLDEQARHIAYVLRQANLRSARSVEPTQEAQDAWVQAVLKYARSRERYLQECTPGYYNNEGHFDQRSAKNGQYWKGADAFFRELAQWREQGTLQGLALTTGRADSGAPAP
jgi:cyclohexanone monooxygenase